MVAGWEDLTNAPEIEESAMVSAATPLVRATSLTGRPVVTKDGAAAGEIQDLVLDDDGRTIAGFTLREPGVLGRRHVAVVNIGSVTAIGPDAVVIPSMEDLKQDERDPAVCADVLGSRVVTDAGIDLGKISDVVVETRRNRVTAEALEISAGGTARYLVLDKSARLAGDVVVVASGSESRLHKSPEEVAERLARRRQ